MKNLAKKVIICLIIVTYFFSVPACYAQKWSKYVAKSMNSYETGGYKKARKFASKVIKKSPKKLGGQNKYLATCLVLDAQIDWATGLHSEIAGKLEKGITMSAAVNEKSPADHALLLHDAAHVWADYGHFLNAGQLIEQSRQAYKAVALAAPEQETKLDMLEAKILIGKGFYKSAISLINNQLDNLKTKYIGVKKEDAKYLKLLYGELMVHKADAYRLMGDYFRSDSAFIATQKWVGKELGKSTLSYGRALYLNAKLLEENGLNPKALPDKYSDAMKHVEKANSSAHVVRIDIMESLVRSYWRTDNFSKTNNTTNLFKETVRKSFDKKSIHKSRVETLPLDIHASGSKIVKQENDAVKKAYGNLYSETHPERSKLLEFSYKASILNNNPIIAKNHLVEIVRLKKNLLGEDAPEYHLAQVKLANHYTEYNDKFVEVEQIYAESFTKIVSKEYNEGHTEYVNILNHLALFYEENDDFASASKTLNKALIVSRAKYDNKDVNYGVELEKIATLQLKIGEYDKAEKNIDEAEKILEKPNTDDEKIYYTNLLVTKASLMLIKGYFDDAEDLLDKSDDIKFEAELMEVAASGDITENQANLFYHLGRYAEANKKLNAHTKKIESQYGAGSRQLMRPLVLQAQLKLAEGEYTESDNLARRALDIGNAIFPPTSSKLAGSLLALSRLNTTLGDYDKAEEYISQAIINQEKQFGRTHVDVGSSLSHLGMIKFYQNAPFLKQEVLLREAEQIVGARLGRTSPRYAEVLTNLATISIYAEQYDQALSYLDQAWNIWKDKIGKRNNINAASINTLKGDIQYQKKEYDKADNFYRRALKTYENFFSDNHPEYVKVLSKLAKTYYMNGDVKKAQSTIEETLTNYQEFIKVYFPALSEREKAKFWNTIKPDYEFYNTLILTRLEKNDALVGNIYNNALLTKALLLNSSIKVRERISSSGDSVLISLFNKWQSSKELLTFALSLSNEQLTENNIDPTKLVQEVELLEKELGQKSEVFSKGYDKKVVKWEDVKKSLKENEVAIEIVRFRYFNHDFTDSIMYAVIYIKGDRKSKPELALLRNGTDLEGRYLRFYQNSIRFKVEDKYSYQQYWKPIIEAIGEASTIYLSSDGAFNQINLEAIPTGNGKYVLDNANIVLISNTKDLVTRTLPAKAAEPRENIALIFGDPMFYVSSTGASPETKRELSRSIGMKEISRLPGTRDEVIELKQLLAKSGWKTLDYMEVLAAEDQVKKISSPKVFHIATHGFFQPNVHEKEIFAGLNEAKAYDNPLMRSGLMLAGAGDILNKSAYNYNTESGILTAYEAMNLNLDQTSLVVLSACETGLGDVEAGEGVFGLQRAFQVAGAKNIVMSLFKVADQATRELMIKFYENWLTTGDLRTAFVDAKKEIRTKYQDPIYWGPFVMIGLD